MLTLEPKWESLWIWRWVMSECGMRYSNLRCFPFLDLNRLRTWPQVHILRQAVNDQIWVGKKPDSSPVGQLLDLILSIRAPGARIYNLSYSLHPSFLRLVSALSFLFSWASILSIGCIVEGRRLPLVVAVHSVQWRIVSRANQPPGAHVTIFSFSGSHYLAFPMYSMQPAIRKARLASQWTDKGALSNVGLGSALEREWRGGSTSRLGFLYFCICIFVFVFL